ncbi:MAG: EAL and HDOD domain-containing protein [Burkholderiales bacterium]
MSSETSTLGMDSNANTGGACQLPQVEEFFLARQPILNREQALIAYELLFRRAGGNEAGVSDDLSATASVIAHVSELGMENVIGSRLGFFNIDAVVLMSDFVRFLPSDKVILEILETVQVTPAVVARVAELHVEGYQFALDDVIDDSEGLRLLLPYVSVIKIDILGMQRADLVALCMRFRSAGKIMLAEKVERIEEFELCLSLGFDYFQGYYFARPVIMNGKKLSSSQIAIMQLMAQLDADADNAVLARSIKHDAALGITLLRMVNTPATGIIHRIDSLQQALTVLGRRQLHRWLQILLYVESSKTDHIVSPLLLLASSRGKLLELMTLKLRPGEPNRADMAFTVGIMSLMDTLFGLPMEKILEQMPVVGEVRAALLTRQGQLGDMLKLVECLERMEESGSSLRPALRKLDLTSEELNEIQVAAFEWSESIARAYP